VGRGHAHIAKHVGKVSQGARRVAGVSKTVLCPNGPNFLIGCEFATLSLSERFVKRRGLFRQFNDGLIFTRQFQQQTGQLVLRLRRKLSRNVNSIFKKLRHNYTMAQTSCPG
jgi:hypothetical protein